jgi:hypothetical protein
MWASPRVLRCVSFDIGFDVPRFRASYYGKL